MSRDISSNALNNLQAVTIKEGECEELPSINLETILMQLPLPIMPLPGYRLRRHRVCLFQNMFTGSTKPFMSALRLWLIQVTTILLSLLVQLQLQSSPLISEIL